MTLHYYFLEKNEKKTYKYNVGFYDYIKWFSTKYNISMESAKEIVEKYIDHDQEMIFFDSADKDLMLEICYGNATKKFRNENKMVGNIGKLYYE